MLAPQASDPLTEKIIGFAIEVHRQLGPGLLESAYEECLCYELKQSGLIFQRQLPLPVLYKAIRLDCGYRIDIVVEKKVILELKTVERLIPVHDAQLLTYLKLSRLRTGLLLNFNSPTLKDGIRRMVL
jgi:GxxExxY protein